MSEQAVSSDTYDLFMGTLDVVNQALKEHADTPVIGEILSAAGKFSEGKRLGVAVYKTDPDEPFDYFTLRIANGKVELDSRGKGDPDIAWRVSQDYLRKVNENPQDYVDNPAKLDLDWLKSRLGL